MPDTPVPSLQLPDVTNRTVLLWGTGALGEATLADVADTLVVIGVIHGGPDAPDTWNRLRVSSPSETFCDQRAEWSSMHGGNRPRRVRAAVFVETSSARCQTL